MIICFKKETTVYKRRYDFQNIVYSQKAECQTKYIITID